VAPAQVQRDAERDAAAIEAGELARSGRAGERVEDREDRAAVRGLGQALECLVEGEDQVVAADLQSVTKRGIDGDHEIIFECRRPF
jgi:hypothetical protein